MTALTPLRFSANSRTAQAWSKDLTWRYTNTEDIEIGWILERWNPDVKDYVEVYSGFTSLTQARASTADPTWVAWLRDRILARDAV